PSKGRVADLPEPGIGEDAAGADVVLAPRDLLPRFRQHRVGLEGSRATLSREVDRGPGQGACDTATAKPGPGCEADDRPHAVVRLVLVPILPGDGSPHTAWVGGAGLHRAPTDRLAVEVRDEPARPGGAGITAMGLGLQPLHPARDLERLPFGPAPHLVLLALAIRGVAAVAEDRSQVLPGGLVRGHHGHGGRDVDSRRRDGAIGHGQTRSRNSSTRFVSSAAASASYDGSELSAK